MSAADREPGFAFARQLPRDPELRRRLKMIGHRSGMPIAVVGSDKSWRDALSLLHEDGDALLARQNDNEPHGWELHYVLRKSINCRRGEEDR